MNFQTGLEITICGAESALDAPSLPPHSSHLCCHKRWGRQNWLCPCWVAGNPRYAAEPML